MGQTDDNCMKLYSTNLKRMSSGNIEHLPKLGIIISNATTDSFSLIYMISQKIYD